MPADKLDLDRLTQDDSRVVALPMRTARMVVLALIAEGHSTLAAEVVQHVPVKARPPEPV